MARLAMYICILHSAGAHDRLRLDVITNDESGVSLGSIEIHRTRQEVPIHEPVEFGGSAKQTVAMLPNLMLSGPAFCRTFT